MSALDQLLSVLAPHECLGCRIEDTLLCDLCVNRLKPIQVPLPPDVVLDSLQAACIYDGLAKTLLWQLKSGGTQAAARTMAQLMAPLVSAESSSLLVPVPTATSRVRQRGYDQATLLARALSRQTGLPIFPCLIRTSQVHQVGATRQARLQQVFGSLRVTKQQLLKGADVILIDDVTTTGTTLLAAAHLLQDVGAGRVEAITFAYTLPKQLTLDE